METGEQLFKRLDKFKSDNKLSQRALARQINISDASLSQLMKGEYLADTTEMENKIRSFLQLQTEKTISGKRNIEFIMTANAERVLDIARHCHVDSRIGICCGEAGTGKTTACKEYARQNYNAVYIKVNPLFSTGTFVRELAEHLGIPAKGTIGKMSTEIIHKLEGTNKILIVDEAEYLPVKGIEFVRMIYDESRIGVLLVGLPLLHNNIMGANSEHKQLWSRCAMVEDLKTLSVQEAGAIASQFFDIDESLAQSFHLYSQGNPRQLDNLIYNVQRIIEKHGGKISMELIKAAYGFAYKR